MPHEPAGDLEEIVAAVGISRKYRSVCQDTIRQIAARELALRDSVKAVTKATKRQLHQVYGAFEEDLDYGRAYQKLEAAYGTGSEAEIESACRQVLVLHSSTRERVPILDGFYPAIFEITGYPGSILDLGCGLNPLTLPWMGPGLPLRYAALDIDAERIRFVNRFLLLAGLEPLARWQDILVDPPEDKADLALLLKMSPSLERQAQGSTQRLLERLNTPFVVVSFALKSLGGREKGMADHYGRQFQAVVEDPRWSVQKLSFETELIFVVQK